MKTTVYEPVLPYYVDTPSVFGEINWYLFIQMFHIFHVPEMKPILTNLKKERKIHAVDAISSRLCLMKISQLPRIHLPLSKEGVFLLK